MTQKKKKMTIADVDKIIKDEKLNIHGHEDGWEQSLAVNMADSPEAAAYAKIIFDTADRWGRLMQTEIKQYDSKYLTPAIVKQTEFVLDDLSTACARHARDLLVSTWVHGAELGKIYGWAPKVIENSRRNFSNQYLRQQAQRTR